MFTGIIRDMGTIFEVNDTRPDCRFVIGTMLPKNAWRLGASVACGGCCLTVVEEGDDWFAIDASRETLSCTTLSRWHVNGRVNLEPSLRMGDDMGGHFVTGHVDGIGHVEVVDPVGGSHRLVIAVPPPLVRFIAAKGSLVIDGVSLTVNRHDHARAEVNIIPYTWAMTTLGQLREGDPVNLEIDMMARYVARMLDHERESRSP